MIKRANPTVVYHGVNIGSGSYPCNVYMELDANGEFVLYEDHLAECDGYMSELADYERTVIRLRKELAEKDVYIHQLRGALGYPVPGDIPPNPNILNGIADALQIQLAEKMSKEDSDD